LKRSGAKSVTAVIPYLGYERQDHVFREGEDVSLAVIIKTLEAVGVDKVVVFDLHSIRIPELFKIPVLHLSALDIFSQKIRELGTKDSLVLVSPDMGGIRRIKILSESLDIPFATIEKNRDLETGDINDASIEGNVEGKTAVIVDDMISTGRTIVAAIDILLKKGAGKIYVFATHAIFSKEAPRVLENSKAEKIFVTDTIHISKEKKFAKLEILSVSETITKGLKNF
jgi:ribose-phosphate pyrophosphokinase